MQFSSGFFDPCPDIARIEHDGIDVFLDADFAVHMGLDVVVKNVQTGRVAFRERDERHMGLHSEILRR
ncbi:hypothetical protein ASC70_02185 [Caulobacter sp. Root343]|nr:hypothetical protein ASC62_11235 [Caulobacter sp. Root342]KQV72505.1 hypothetical protein ASC70_02185 [Caulobacter sp. Root343]